MLGAALVLASAAIHMHLWATGYRHIGTIGPLFFTQGALGIALGILVALVRRPFIALLAALFALGTIVGLLLASHRGLFGYRTTMKAPWATTALSIEVAAVVLLCLGSVLAVSTERAHARYMRSFKSPEL
jgi:urea transporter